MERIDQMDLRQVAEALAKIECLYWNHSREVDLRRMAIYDANLFSTWRNLRQRERTLLKIKNYDILEKS